MANVPNDFISEQPVEGAVRSEQEINVNPAAFGSTIVAATERAGSQIEEGAYRIIDRNNYIQVERARANFMAAVDTKSQELMSKRGEDAAGTPVELNQFINQQRQQVVQGLTERQQNLFDLDTLRYARFAQNGMDRWAREQHTVAVQTTATRGAAGAAIGMRQATTSEMFDYQKQQLDKYTTDYTTAAGMSPEAAAEYKASKMSDALMGTVNALRASDKPDEAADFLDKYKDQIDPAAHGYGAYQKQLRQQGVLLRSQNAAAEIWGNFSGQNSQPDVKAMYEEANTLAPEIRQQAVGRIRQMVTEYNEGMEKDNKQGSMTFHEQMDAWIQNSELPPSQQKDVPDPRKFTVAQMRDNGYPESLIDTLQKEQLSKTGNEDAGSLADSISARIGDLNPRAPVADFNREHDAIMKDIGQLHSMDKYTAQILRGELSKRVLESQKLDPGVESWLNGDKHKDLPGIRDRISSALGAMKTLGTPGLGWLGIGKKPLFTPEQRATTVSEVYGNLLATAKAHPDWDAAQMEDYAAKDSTIQQILTNGAMAKWKAQLKNGGEPVAAFDPSSVKAE